MQKNKKCNEKLTVEKELSEFGLRLGDDLQSIGIIFDHLGLSHKTYLAITNFNKLCKKYYGIDVCFFSQHMLPPCTTTLFPVCGIGKIFQWPHTSIISTSVLTTFDALNMKVQNIFHYMFDPDFLEHRENTEIAFKDPRIIMVVRHEEHKKLIEHEFGIKVNHIIPDFDAEALCKLVIQTEKSNGKYV